MARGLESSGLFKSSHGDLEQVSDFQVRRLCLYVPGVNNVAAAIEPHVPEEGL